ncbi:PorP/SprF family type IX secretion system membrane protein [Chondrinema litorale]|uniref:PorP/SprF family type IX secretion system membrane protein n=1 Tax=Chondrinema litorale TaxID=2994555 RepID=UPI002543D459|nr:PorP/SprF family type IX secretion system membrane protein [Chondrinema litorale]UZR96715.1 PorP/SprF family type IX secretion system membrane protein [Chondrinema litorale]
MNIQKYKVRIFGIAFIGLCFVLLNSQKSFAQLYPLGSSLYQNNYLTNPAEVGSDNKLLVNLAYRQQATAISSGQISQSATVGYSLGEKVGLGVNILREEIGLFNATKAVATYAYHLPLNQNGRSLSFGLSLGIIDQQINTSDISGSIDDPLVAAFNDQGIYVDGDFGITFTENNFKLQGSVLNLRSRIEGEEGEFYSFMKSTIFAAASYKFNFAESTSGISLEPKLCYRNVEGFDDIIDGGVNLGLLEDKFNVFGMYHSSQNTTLGIGATIKSILKINAMYTTETKDLSGYAGSNFEIGMQLALGVSK